MPQPNPNIDSLQITVRLVAGNSPGFEIEAGASTAGGPGNLPFNCSGIGHSNEDLLKEILQKIIASYPAQPISLCLDGTRILSSAQCPQVVAAAGAMVAAVAEAARASVRSLPKSVKKVAAKPGVAKKAAAKFEAAEKATAKTKAAKKAGAKRKAADKVTPSAKTAHRGPRKRKKRGS